MPFVPRFPLSTTTVSMPGPSKQEMFLMEILPPLPPGTIPGNCFHTCIMHVNVGKTNQKKIGMHYHYVSEPSRAHLSISTQRSSWLWKCSVCSWTFHHECQHDEQTQAVLHQELSAYDEHQEDSKRQTHESKEPTKKGRRLGARSTTNGEVFFLVPPLSRFSFSGGFYLILFFGFLSDPS